MRKPLAAGVLLVVAIAWPRAQPVGLTETARLAAVYDTILRAQFERTESELARACPPAPDEACRSLTAARWWWEIQLDPHSRHLDRHFSAAVESAVASAERWTEREPRRAEAWFYLAASQGALAQWRVLRGERLAAARTGKGIKSALEQSLALDPSLNDAYFGIGLYHYVADVAPTALKMLRWLLWLPGGDRTAGLSEMRRAQERGTLLRWEANWQMHWLYVWYEREPARAIELLQELDARFPTNPVFLQRIAEIRSGPLHDPAGSRNAWQQLFDRAHANQVAFPALADARARLGLAAEWVALAQPQRAIEILQPLLGTPPSLYGAHALVDFAHGSALAAAGDRDRALIAWRSAITHAPSDDPDRIRARSRAAIARVTRKK